MNNANVVNPYTKKIPAGSLTQVHLTAPTAVQIAWPNRSGGNLPVNAGKGKSFLRKLFG